MFSATHSPFPAATIIISRGVGLFLQKSRFFCRQYSSVFCAGVFSSRFRSMFTVTSCCTPACCVA